MSSFFIKHPTIAIVISIVMILLGGLSLMGLPIEQYPNIVPPTIKMQATYPGANAETVANSVASPIEQSISGVVGMDYMTSTNANNGICSLSIVFEVGTDPNMDQTLAYMRYGQATAQIPAEVSQMGITITQSTGSPLAVVNLYSPDDSLNAIFLSNYAYVSLVDPVKRVPGVGDVQVFGAGRYAMRIWLDTTKMAAQNISVGEVQSAIQAQNTVIPGGQIGAEPAPPGTEFTYSIQTKGRLQTAEEFGNIIIRAEGNKLLYLKDIAKVELGSQTYNVSSKYNGRDSGAIAVYAAPGSNAINTVDALVKLFEDRSRSFPAGMEYNLTLDTTLAVRASIEEIEHTLVEALLLVVLVVFVFLQGWRATLIPAIAVPVSIIATFALFPLLGFTLNTICLMGMVLAIGLVVDDAIVVVENSTRLLDTGQYSARQAVTQAMGEITGPIVGVVLVLLAVFIPTMLVSGISGQLYKQFALTIAASTVLSGFNSLTLTPALCALILQPTKPAQSPLFRGFNFVYDKTQGIYDKTVGWLLRRPAAALLSYAGFTALAVILFMKWPSTFIPEEDDGYFLAVVQLPPASSLERTEAVGREINEILNSYPEVKNYIGISGFSVMGGGEQSNSGTYFVILKNWDERKGKEHTAQSVVNRFNAQAYGIQEAEVFAMVPPAIPGLGATGGLQLQVEDRNNLGATEMQHAVETLMATYHTKPALASVSSQYQANVPQYFLNIDRDKVQLMGIPLNSVFTSLGYYMGAAYVNDFVEFGRIYQVKLGARDRAQRIIDDVLKLSVQNASGEMVPFSAFMRVEEQLGMDQINRYNMYSTASVTCNVAPGSSSGEAIQQMEALFKEQLGDKFGYEWTSVAYQETQAGTTTTVVFVMALLVAFLVLAAQYESWTSPVAAVIGLPVALLGAMIGCLIMGTPVSIYTQIGIILLVALSAKNGILIVEFARDFRAQGNSIRDAAFQAGHIRLRPILMTSLAFVFGVMPLLFATGAGAESRIALGAAVVFGMALNTLLATVYIPNFYELMQKIQEKLGKKQIEEKTEKV